MTFSKLDLDFSKRIEFLRRICLEHSNPLQEGDLNQDSLIFLAKFASGQTDKLMHVTGAMKCSGATKAQMGKVIDLLGCGEFNELYLEEFPRVVVEKLGYRVSHIRTFPAELIEHLEAPPPLVETLIPHNTTQHSHQDKVVTAKDEKENSTEKQSPFSTLLVIIFSLVLLSVVLGFFVLWSSEGWEAANRKNPAGAAIFFITSVVVYLFAIPFLKDRGFRVLPKAMSLVALMASVLFVVINIPSCNHTDTEFPLDRPYRK